MTATVLSPGVAARAAPTGPVRTVATTVAAVGAVAAGVALLEAALIPGVVIGGGAVLALRYLPGLRRRPAPQAGRLTLPRPLAAPPEDVVAPSPPARFGIKQAVAKTITFRIIVTSLDFTTN